MKCFLPKTKPLAILLLQVVLFISCSKDELLPASSSKSKALLVYMIADNDLDFYATANINQMEAFMAQNPNQGSIYLYIDRAKNRKTAHPILYHISADTTNAINSKILKVYPEQNSADGQNFKNILDEAHAIAFAQNEHLRGLVLWSHGSAWLSDSSSLSSHRTTAAKSFGSDQTTPNGSPTQQQMNIQNLSEALSGYHFDFLLFDACFMASVEVFYQLKNHFDYIIASPTEVLASGFPYKDILADMLASSPNYHRITEKYVAHFQQKKGVLQSAAAVVINTKALERFAHLFKKYFSESKKRIDTSLWLQYDQEQAGFLFDMGDFIAHLEENQPHKELTHQLKRMVIAYHHTPYFFEKIPLTNSSGISIFVPQITTKKAEYEFYKTLSWYAVTALAF